MSKFDFKVNRGEEREYIVERIADSLWDYMKERPIDEYIDDDVLEELIEEAIEERWREINEVVGVLYNDILLEMNKKLSEDSQFFFDSIGER